VRIWEEEGLKAFLDDLFGLMGVQMFTFGVVYISVELGITYCVYNYIYIYIYIYREREREREREERGWAARRVGLVAFQLFPEVVAPGDLYSGQ